MTRSPSPAVLRGDRDEVHLTYALPEDRDAFLDAVARSRRLHGGWSDPPATVPAAERYLAASGASASRPDEATTLSYLVRWGPSGDLVAVINANDIVRRAFQSTALGFAAFEPHAGRGRTRRGVALVLDELFGARSLHRAEANVRPDNVRSLQLVRRLGFRHEGTSPRMLFLDGAWRDHERFAILADEWPSVAAAARTSPSGTHT